MAQVLSVTEVVRNFADYMNRVAYRRESFVLVRGSKPVAELRPVPAGKRLGELPDLIASLPRLDDEDFASDIETAREQLASKGVVNPWQS